LKNPIPLKAVEIFRSTQNDKITQEATLKTKYVLKTVAVFFFSSIFLFNIKAYGETVSYIDAIQNRIFNVSCTGCHGKYSVSIKRVNLTSYDRIVEHELLVIPANPDASLLFTKTDSGHGGLSISEMNDLYDWILQGAEDD
jgi:hypothetical protein